MPFVLSDMMVIDRETIQFVANKKGISFQEAENALKITESEIDIMLDSDLPDEKPKYQIEHVLKPEEVNIKEIADSLNLDEAQFSTWVEDDMVWVLYGPNIADGIAGEGPTPKFATANFYQRWYEELNER